MKNLNCKKCKKSFPEVMILGMNKMCENCRELRIKELSKYSALKRREYREKSPHLTFFSTSQYQAKKENVFSDLTVDDALYLRELPDICGYCGSVLDRTKKRAFHLDHVIPMCQGGPNSKWNIIKACMSCNMSKGRSSLINFYNRRSEFPVEQYYGIVNDMVELSGFPRDKIEKLLEFSHSFEKVFEEKRERMMKLIRKN